MKGQEEKETETFLAMSDCLKWRISISIIDASEEM